MTDLSIEELWRRSKERDERDNAEWAKKSPEEKKRLLNDPLYHRMTLDCDEDVPCFREVKD